VLGEEPARITAIPVDVVCGRAGESRRRLREGTGGVTLPGSVSADWMAA
jgi:hypothetical protein